MLKRFLQRRRRAKRSGMNRAAILELFREKYLYFTTLLSANATILMVIAEIEQSLKGREPLSRSAIRRQVDRVKREIPSMVESFEGLSGRCYLGLHEKAEAIERALEQALAEEEANENGGNWVISAGIDGQALKDANGVKRANPQENPKRLDVPIPPGFTITAAAVRHMLTRSGLLARIRQATADLKAENIDALMRVSGQIGHWFEKASVPVELAAALHAAFAALVAQAGRDWQPLGAVLFGSAEDQEGELVCAGHARCAMQVGSENLLEAFKQVLASLYAAPALAYRLNRSMPPEKAFIGIACQPMSMAKASGVAFTRHPLRILDDHVIVDAVWGFDLYALDGMVTPDRYTFSKEAEPQMLGCRIRDKRMRLVPGSEGRLVREPVEPDLRKRPCLREEQARALALLAMRLEAHHGSPQEVAWALDPSDRLRIVQSSPLRMAGSSTLQSLEEPPPVGGSHAVLCQGEVASPGVGCGVVFLASAGCELAAFPAGGVLVAPHPEAHYGIVMAKAQAIIIDSGSLTGHLARVAREYGLPALFNTQIATRTLKAGMRVTVDAYGGRVYGGELAELLCLRLEARRDISRSENHALLRRVAGAIVPLNLNDPASAGFYPSGCRTVHDIARLLHEWSYQEIFRLGDYAANGEQLAIKLDAAINLDLWVIDLGGGLAAVQPHARSARLDQVGSRPFGALLRGLVVNHKAEPRAVDMGGFFSVMSRQMMDPAHQATERFGEKSFAIVSDRYMNFSSRVGYHYSVLDSYCGQTINKNYINFEFKGGAADEVRRNRRARAIVLMLQQAGFTALATDDRVQARYAQHPPEQIERQLEMVGRLLQYTRQMDMLMHSEAAVELAAQKFHEGHEAFHGSAAPLASA